MHARTNPSSHPEPSSNSVRVSRDDPGDRGLHNSNKAGGWKSV